MNDKVNDSINIGNYLWLATKGGVIKINQITREYIKYTTEEESNLHSNKSNSIDTTPTTTNIWIGTYGCRMAFISDEEKWESIPYTSNLFEEDALKKDKEVILDKDKDNWLRTNLIHFDINDTLWIGTNTGLPKDEDEKSILRCSFSSDNIDKHLNVLSIKDVENDIEMSSNFRINVLILLKFYRNNIRQLLLKPSKILHKLLRECSCVYQFIYNFVRTQKHRTLQFA